MKTGNELIAELESQIEYRRNIQKDRDTRIANHEMDLDDCFISVNVTSDAIQELKAKIEILKKGGVSIFERIATLNGDIIENSRIIDGKYGECWLADGIFVSIPSAGCKAGKQVWINAGFKNHADAHNQLCEELNTDEFRERNNLYYKLSREAIAMGMA